MHVTRSLYHMYIHFIDCIKTYFKVVHSDIGCPAHWGTCPIQDQQFVLNSTIAYLYPQTWCPWVGNGGNSGTYTDTFDTTDTPWHSYISGGERQAPYKYWLPVHASRQVPRKRRQLIWVHADKAKVRVGVRSIEATTIRWATDASLGMYIPHAHGMPSLRERDS